MKIKTLFTGSVLTFLFAIATVAVAEEPHWDHTMQADWGKLEDSSQTEVPKMYPFAECSIGHHQSPVDLTSTSASKRLNRIKTLYPADTVDFYNTGHAVQVNFSDHYQGQLLVGAAAYPLIQLHFHAPSEHVIDTQTFPAELHFVHVRDDGKIAVLGVLMEIGEENQVFQTILDNMPPTEKSHNADTGIHIKPTLLLPHGRKHYHTLAGSLTTPPCSEGVDWYILTNTITISEEQLNRLKGFYDGNARLPQALNDRVVAEKN